MATTNAFLAAALAAAERGWHVFPVRPGDKRPAFPDHTEDRCTGRDPRCRTAGRHIGWEPRATTDPDRIRRAWTAAPYNIGIACGPSGLVVVDLDTPKSDDIPPDRWRAEGIHGVHDGSDVFALVCEHDGGGDWPIDTYTVDTPSGGIHLYYQHPAGETLLRNTSGDVGSGLGWLIDTRAHGGYILGAGSVVNGRPYAVAHDTGVMLLPGWLANRLTPAPLRPREPVTVALGTGRRAAYLRAAVDRQVEHVTSATTDRNFALYVAAKALGELVAGGALDAGHVEHVLTDAAHTVGLHRDPPPGQIPRTIASGLRAGARHPRSVAA